MTLVCTNQKNTISVKQNRNQNIAHVNSTRESKESKGQTWFFGIHCK